LIVARGFKRHNKFIPTDGSPLALNLEQVGITNLNSPSRSVINKIKEQNLDSKGNFSKDSKKIPLESIKTLARKKNLFLLKGTNPTDQKTVTKTVKLAN